LDIDSWLRGIGLAQYADMFRANDIDFIILRELTDLDLEKIGVVSLGHRRKLLRAIAELGGAVAATPVMPMLIPSAATPPPLAASAEAAAERRHLTVMFCDLVGSTAISARLDAEEWRDLVGAYLDAASAEVVEMGGYVAKKLGDGLMSLFGYPVAQENDSERAVRAALAIQRSLVELNRKNAGSGKPTLAARIGLETGPVVVDAAGEIFGDAPNVAARVQALAEPNEVVVTARVQRQVAGLFVAEERGTHALKGVLEPTALFRLIRPSGGGRRSAQRNLSPLVGRDEEIAVLMRRWERARQGDGQLVLIVGEAGLGKSRLIEEFHIRLRETPHTWNEWSCSQLLQNTPLHPIAEWGRQRFGSADALAERRLADLESSLIQVKLDPVENASLLAPLVDIPLPKERVPTFSPEELRRRQLAAMMGWVIAGAKVQPVVLVFEDLHWADPTTLDLLRGISERGASAPLFIVATTRPEFRQAWSMRPHHGTISLAPLDRSQVRNMVAELSARHALSRDVVEDVAARTGGVPLFVEEVTRLLLERGEQGGMQAIPPTLQQSLMARLDRLGAAREVAQIGSVIGRDFSYSLLRALAAMKDGALQAALERLAEADILLVQGLPPESEYRFKHALIQDAAYENLLKSRRQVLHRAVAEILHEQVAAGAAEPEPLAHHYTRAGMKEAAIEWWGKAGQRSLERSALVEAVEQFTRALKLIADLPSTPALRHEEIKLQVALVTPLMHIKGFSAPEPKAAADKARLLIERAETLGEPQEDPLLLFSALYGAWVAKLVSFDGDDCRDLAAHFLALAEKDGTTVPVMVGHRLMGTSLLCAGDIVQSRLHLDRAIALYNPKKHRSLATRFGQDVRTAALIYRSWAFWILGFPQAAFTDAEHARNDAREIGQATTLMAALSLTSLAHMFLGNYTAAQAQSDEVIPLANEKGAALWKSWGMMNQGCVLALTGKVEEALQTITAGIIAWRSTGATTWLPPYLSYLAKAYADLGRFEEARRTITEAMTVIEATQERWCEAEVQRTAGEIALMLPQPNPVKAKAFFEQALTIARHQRAKSWELRAAMSMARLWQDQGKPQQAREILGPIYGWFTEGFDTLDLKEAKALLDKLTN
jgi:class 3 adenylate cyclase/predicted ATPase